MSRSCHADEADQNNMNNVIGLAAVMAQIQCAVAPVDLTGKR